MSKNIFFIGLIIAASGLISPPVALAVGLVYGFSFLHPFHVEARKLSKLLLQASVVGLGFGMDLQQVMQAGRSGFIYTAGSISFALLLGWGLGKLFRVKQRISYLISAGTAICGGSAIAAIAPITNASQEEIAVSLGTVFVLNSVALLTFPAIGTALHMTQSQFGLWAALAIHDVSSVVGATAKYGAVALTVGTTVKLADRTGFGRNRSGKQEQGAHSMAMVYSLLLSRGCFQYLRPLFPARLSSAQASWKHRPDRHALSDWNGTLYEDSPRCRRSTVPSGNPSMDLRRRRIADAHSRWLDSLVELCERLVLCATVKSSEPFPFRIGPAADGSVDSTISLLNCVKGYFLSAQLSIASICL
jgi:hypothetical protein